LPITQLRRVLEHHVVESNFSRYEEDRWHYYGQTIFIETKRPSGGKLSQEQIDFGKAARAVGAEYIAPTSVEEVLRLLGPVPDWVREDRG